MHRFRSITFLSLLLALALAACGGATPRLIGAYPQDPIATYVPPSASRVTVYHLQLDLQVADVDAAAQRAERLAAAYNGYLTDSQTWLAGGQPQAALVLIVPPAQFDHFHQALLGLGDLAGEHVSGEVTSWSPPQEEWMTYSQINLHLSAQPALPSLPASTWHPVQTFTRALSVVAAIFSVLSDIAIWIVVIGGPFLLLGLGLRWFVRRWLAPRQKS